MNTIRLTRVAIVLRRARHDGRHPVTTVCWRVNVTWTGAPPLLHIQAVVVLTKQTAEMKEDQGVKTKTNRLVTGQSHDS